eukprot:gnl/TRDRNA2_/TRDRNA2_120136_c0_seq1.p1 gnl/TRDRNA2_/TRDRNA2_120136_c0~~gnl/TRDRNA2_/TRDRNA2_120136_c0_seq1.p1  ORF type:complete len:165 (-),score=12.89 gnl/TRDRNA2_/TRDRNA2_120136_c0_seq1:6-437(-)
MPTPLTVGSFAEAFRGAVLLGSSGQELPMTHIVSSEEPIAIRYSPVNQYIADQRAARSFGATTSNKQLFDSLHVDIVYGLANRIMELNKKSPNPLKIATCDIDRLGIGLYRDFEKYNRLPGCHLDRGSMDAVRQYAESRSALC